MVARIGDYLLAGELRNDRPNSVFGWLEFAPDYGIRIELTGNFTGDLAGKRVRFVVPNRDPSKNLSPGEFPESVEELANRQIGVVDRVELGRKKIPALPIDDFLDLSEEEREKNLLEKDCLHFSWYGQNGQVVADIIEPRIEYVENEPDNMSISVDYVQHEDGTYDISIKATEIEEDLEEAFNSGDEEDEDPEDPFGLFDDNLERRVADALEVPEIEDDEAQSPDDLEDIDHGLIDELENINEKAEETKEDAPRSWEEVIPGIDPDVKAMYEQWDEIFEGKHDQPISYLFRETLKLPKPDNVKSDEEAEPLVKAILAQLALLSVALDVCEHFSPMAVYRLLINEILPTARVHPNLAASEMVQHYATSDFCTECDAEIEDDLDV